MARKRSDRSERLLLGTDARRKQKTRPKKGEPVEIPIPSKRDVMCDLEKIANPNASGQGTDES